MVRRLSCEFFNFEDGVGLRSLILNLRFWILGLQNLVHHLTDEILPVHARYFLVIFERVTNLQKVVSRSVLLSTN